MTLQNNDFFFICSPLMRHQLIELFHLSNLVQILNNHRMVNIEFFGNFSCSCKRISFSDPLNWSLSNSDGQPPCSSSSRLSLPFATFLDPPLPCMFISSSWAQCVVDVVSCLCCITNHFELE